MCCSRVFLIIGARVLTICTRSLRDADALIFAPICQSQQHDWTNYASVFVALRPSSLSSEQHTRLWNHTSLISTYITQCLWNQLSDSFRCSIILDRFTQFCASFCTFSPFFTHSFVPGSKPAYFINRSCHELLKSIWILSPTLILFRMSLQSLAHRCFFLSTC